MAPVKSIIYMHVGGLVTVNLLSYTQPVLTESILHSPCIIFLDRELV